MPDLPAFLAVVAFAFAFAFAFVGVVNHALALRDRWRGTRHTPPDTR